MIRNSVRHEFPNDCNLSDIYEAHSLSQVLIEKPRAKLIAEEKGSSYASGLDKHHHRVFASESKK